MDTLLGIDIGTSGTKVALFDLKGGLIAASTQEYPLQQPYSGWAEQKPEDWWAATVRGIRSVLNSPQATDANVLGIGLSGQMHGAVLLDRKGQVIRPAIIWCDQRSASQAENLQAQFGPDIIALTGNPALPNFTATKLLWVRENEPGNYERIAKVLLPKDYIRFRLTGSYATEVSDASGTLLFDVENRKWSQDMLKLLDISLDWLPESFESVEVSGKVIKEAAQLTGLTQGTPVVGGAGDQAAGAVGNGIVEEGLVSTTIGTSGVVFAATDRLILDKRGRLHSFCHAIADKWHVMGVTQSAGGSFQWYRNTFASEAKELAALLGRDSYELLTAEAEQIRAGSEGLIFLPYLMGERTPHLDPSARGVFFGIEARHDKRHFVRAIMEGVTFSLLDCLRLISDLGVDFTEVRASGGGARSPLWRQMMANIFGQPVRNAVSGEGPAFGVALLAGVGVGVYSSVQRACSQTISVGDTVHAAPALHQFYQREYRLFRSLYDSVKGNFQELRTLTENE